ncbi:hypothetical protein E4T56_gene16218 [Termitomyces sp. T112]|nr:hypothetical protein E4T56_gene16218 [Termitomyces sp. T112]
MPPTSPFCKPPTAPHAAVALPAISSEPPDHIALFNLLVKQSAGDVIVAVLHYPALTSALMGCISAAKVLLLSAADHTHFISAVNLIFMDKADFPWIAEQQGLFDALSSLIQSNTLDWSVGDNCAPAKLFFFFADAIIAIESHHHDTCQKELQELCHHAKDTDIRMIASKLDLLACHLDDLTISCILIQADPEGKPYAKKIKVLPSATSHKVGSKAALALLFQVNVALDAVALAKDNSSVSHVDLQKHHDAIDLAAQQQLYTLNLSLQTFKLIPAHLQHLDKVLGPSEVNQTGNLFTELQVSPEACLIMLFTILSFTD